MSFRQIAPRVFPSGDFRHLMVIRLEPEELAERYGLLFVDGNDNLDYYQEATIELPGRTQVWLVRHFNAPEPGTEVTIDADAEFADLKRPFLQALQLSERAIQWISPQAGN